MFQTVDLQSTINEHNYLRHLCHAKTHTAICLYSTHSVFLSLVYEYSNFDHLGHVILYTLIEKNLMKNKYMLSSFVFKILKK